MAHIKLPEFENMTPAIQDKSITGYFNYINTLSNVFGLGV